MFTRARGATSDDILDLDTLEQLRSLGDVHGKYVLAEIVELYKEQTPELLRAARQAIGATDSQGLLLAAHSLKSSSASLGATQLASTCADLESAAAEHRLDDGQKLLASIEAAIPSVLDALGDISALPPDPPAAAANDSYGGPRVLIVDDDPGFRMVVSKSLSDNGFSVIEANSGNSALARIKDQRPDLILLDAIMDGMSGFELCRRLKQSTEHHEIPVLMVTGLNDIESVHKAFDAGATSFAAKPVNYPVLLQQVRFVLRTSRVESELREQRSLLESAQRLGRLGYWYWEPVSGKFEFSQLLIDMLDDGDDGYCTMDHFLSRIEAADRQRVREHIAAAQHGEHQHRIQYRITGVDGRVIEVRQVTDVRRTPAGTVAILATVQDITLELEAEATIRNLAYYDGVTGIASRTLFMQTLEQTLQAAQRSHECFALLFIDLDGFKDINDSLGHDFGDRMLRIVAQRLDDVLREGDFVARLGGDEYCVIGRNISDEYESVAIAQRCIEAVGQPLNLEAHRISPRMSIGIANFPDDANTAHGLIRAADSAMYAAKQAGRNRYAFYSPEMTRQAEERLTLENHLRSAFEERQFQLVYQPQISLESGRMIGVEALIRWQHPEQGLILPNDFVPILERIGLIGKLGDYVINEACAQLQRWIREGADPIRMAVNLSPLELRDSAIVDTVLAAISEHEIDPPYLTLEVTESFSQDYSESLEVLQNLFELGVTIAIDDFGIGYSSLGSLKKLPIQCLKIDRLFIHNMLEEVEDTVLLGAIIGLAHALDLTVIAEGAESLEQVQVLAGIGCDAVQGYFFSKPVHADEARELFGKQFLLDR